MRVAVFEVESSGSSTHGMVDERHREGNIGESDMSPSQTQKVIKFIPEAGNEEMQHRRSWGCSGCRCTPGREIKIGG